MARRIPYVRLGKLSYYRHLLGYTQKDVAEASGVSVGTIRSAEQGGRIREQNAKKIARALGKTVVQLQWPDERRFPVTLRSDNENR